MIGGAGSRPNTLSVPMSSLLKDRDGGEGLVVSLSSPKMAAVLSYRKVICYMISFCVSVSCFPRSSLALVVSRFVQTLVRFTSLILILPKIFIQIPPDCPPIPRIISLLPYSVCSLLP